MVASIFDLFRIGVGPSSSHTMGPMVAAATMRERLPAIAGAARLEVTLYGSLALTGRGHATDRAILLGLAGARPETIDPDAMDATIDRLLADGIPHPGGAIAFVPDRDLCWRGRERLDFHSNAMRFRVLGGDGSELFQRICFSVGGGAVVEAADVRGNAPPDGLADIPHPYRSAADLLALAARHSLTLAAIQRANEEAARPAAEVDAHLARVAATMSACIDRGIAAAGILPGGLGVRRRAPEVMATLVARQERALSDPLAILDWVNLWALAVNEENAAGGRVVTAPTNGAAGIIPAILRYGERFVPGFGPAMAAEFLLTAAAVGSLAKENASISGAEVGCQGEVGVACAMAAAGLAAILGGTAMQVENAAEIALEHNLGLTCDPVGGLVQVPCIERNAVGAVKAIEAARLALLGDGTHRVSLDQVIETMRRTGLDMSDHYKETALGGLAVNVVAC